MDAIDRITARLHYFLSMTEVTSAGEIIEQRKLVEKIGSLRIIIRPKEHPPPHFHVISDSINASFAIETGKKLKGDINSKDLKRILYFHKSSKKLLIKT